MTPKEFLAYCERVNPRAQLQAEREEREKREDAYWTEFSREIELHPIGRPRRFYGRTSSRVTRRHMSPNRTYEFF